MSDGQTRPTAERAPAKKLRKNARPNRNVTVLPKGGLDPLMAKIGVPFSPLDLRQLIDQARQVNPGDVDEAFRKIVAEKTAEQISSLLSRLGLEPTDPDAHTKAFAMLAIALCGVGQVVWTPDRGRSYGWSSHHESTLFWMVRSLCEKEGLTERAAVKRIAEDAYIHQLFPYRPQDLTRDAKLDEAERKFQSLRQAWTKVKAQEKQFLGAGRPQFLDGIFSKEAGYWETQLVTLDIANAAPRSGKNRAR